MVLYAVRPKSLQGPTEKARANYGASESGLGTHNLRHARAWEVGVQRWREV